MQVSSIILLALWFLFPFLLLLLHHPCLFIPPYLVLLSLRGPLFFVVSSAPASPLVSHCSSSSIFTSPILSSVHNSHHHYLAMVIIIQLLLSLLRVFFHTQVYASTLYVLYYHSSHFYSYSCHSFMSYSYYTSLLLPGCAGSHNHSIDIPSIILLHIFIHTIPLFVILSIPTSSSVYSPPFHSLSLSTGSYE